jgi:polyvinyl alcohol dehydrogenase (cytochrome)
MTPVIHAQLRSINAWRTVVGTAVLLWAALVAGIPVASAASGDWPTYQFDNARTGFNSDETTLSSSNVANLTVHWSLQAPGNPNSIFAQPVVANGKIHWGSWNGNEYAVNLSGGNVWSANLGQTVDNACDPPVVGVASTPTVHELLNSNTAVYVGGGDASVFALNATNGSTKWLRSLGSSPSHFVWSSPAVYNGSVYIGNASFGDCPLVQGQLVQLNATTGGIQHVFDVVPSGCAGGGVWGSPTIDEAADRVYFATGNPDPSGNCPSRYTEAVVELNASNLSLIGYWQVRGNDKADLDFGSTPTLFQGVINGITTKMVGLVNKDGNFYAFKRDALGSGPVWTATIGRNGNCPQCGDGSISPAAFDGQYLFVAGGATKINGTDCQGSLSQFVPGTGYTVWRHCLLSGPVLGAVAVVNDVAFLGQGNVLMAIHTKTGGNTLFRYYTPSAIWGAPSVSNGVVYFGTVDGTLYALGL